MIQDYNYIRAFLRQFALSEPLMPMGGYLWGESKRTLDALALGGVYPYLWVMDYRYLLEQTPSHNLNGYWALRCQIKAQANRADELAENNAMQTATVIMWNLITWLWQRYQKREIYIDFSRFNAVPIEVGETDNGHGWEFDLWIGLHEPALCLPSQGRLHWLVLLPEAAVGGTLLAVQSNGLTFNASWNSQFPPGGALEALAAKLRQDGTLGIEVATDGIFLYARSRVSGQAVDLTPLTGAGLHAWQTVYTTPA